MQPLDKTTYIAWWPSLKIFVSLKWSTCRETDSVLYGKFVCAFLTSSLRLEDWVSNMICCFTCFITIWIFLFLQLFGWEKLIVLFLRENLAKKKKESNPSLNEQKKLGLSCAKLVWLDPSLKFSWSWHLVYFSWRTDGWMDRPIKVIMMLYLLYDAIFALRCSCSWSWLELSLAKGCLENLELKTLKFGPNFL